MSLFELKDVSYTYNKGKKNAFTALANVSVTINRGDFAAIIGKSGSGKSTLLSLINGLIKPDSGEYIYDGENMKEMTGRKQAEIRNRKMGYVLQNFGLLNDRNALENVCLPLMFSKTPFSKIEDMAIESMRKVGIEDLKDRKISELSGGQSQRVAIARALVNKPEILLADEPTGALDTENAKHLMELFKMINESGTTVFMVTHDKSITSFCNRLFRVSDGRLKES